MFQIARRGFTLIELMIVVAIVAILVAVAMPSYQSQVRKGKRAEGKAKLVATAQRLERAYSDYSTYACNNVPAGTCGTGTPADDLAPLFGLAAGAAVYSGSNNDPVLSAYRITKVPGVGGYPVAYLLTATPNGSFKDPDCGSLGLDNFGKKWIHEEGVASSVTGSCW